ncbi:RDD family protein [Oscillatoria sp. FACHB-1407]|uniref:RDD family protein n=1 Tax=Oscillatoria sp. FACHB-1407 TaxID=2692847 RepID=UPI0016899016|nr:RDD family protein [Oscillatoria sp. FACHB-1407]MBD2464076.1 RDD family protein [Oscillatoria sp. FACHB-1407]
MRFFNRITLQTPESVELEFTLAGIGNRALALAIDYLVMLIFLGVSLLLWWGFSAQLFRYLDNLQIDYSGLANWLLAIAALLVFFVWIGYFAAFETVWRGQTPGKRFAKIRVIRDDGRPARLPQAILRSLLRPVDDVMSIGMWMIIFGSQEKRLGDWVAGTLVVQEERTIGAAQLVTSNQAQEVADYLLQYADMSLLLPDDFAIVREYLQRRSQMYDQGRSTLSLKLARQVKALLTLEKLPENTTPDHFLEGVYLAYQQHSSQHPYDSP